MCGIWVRIKVADYVVVFVVQPTVRVLFGANCWSIRCASCMRDGRVAIGCTWHYDLD